MYKLKIVELPKPLNIKTQINFPEVVLGKMQEKTIIPKTTFQEVLPDKNYDGLSKVNVEAVTNEIDTNIKSENIKKDVSILGVQGNIEELKGTKIKITKNGTYIPEKPYNAFTEVEANVEADVSDYFTETISGNQYGDLPIVNVIKKLPSLKINNNAIRVFQGCSNLTNISALDTSNVTNMSYMFSACYVLTNIPSLNTTNVTNMSSMFRYCEKLTNIPSLDASKVTNMSSIFQYASSLTTLGGFQNLGQAFLTTASANYAYYTLDISAATNLTHDSLMNVINNLYDIATKGCNAQKLILGSTNLAKLSDEEKVIATNKGWVLS